MFDQLGNYIPDAPTLGPKLMQYLGANQPLGLGQTSPNAQWAVPAPAGGYMTQLSPSDESLFKQWVTKNNVPFDPSPQADYDMRGFWKSLTSNDGHAETGMNANDGKMHFTDYFKTPYHQSFSRESKFATPDAPTWNDKDQLIDKAGNVVFDERAQQPALSR